jgi:hypothetical protein
MPNYPPFQSNWLGKAATDHVQEWLDSGVDPGIIALNVETLTDTATNDYSDSLFPIAERLNWKITRFGQKTRSNLRGWWVSGHLWQCGRLYQRSIDFPLPNQEVFWNAIRLGVLQTDQVRPSLWRVKRLDRGN